MHTDSLAFCIRLMAVAVLVAALIGDSSPALAQTDDNSLINDDVVITMQQSDDLLDGQTVSVTVEGLDRSAGMQGILQCTSGVVDTPDLSQCDTFSLAQPRGSGPGEVQTFEVQLNRFLFVPERVDCAVAGACVITAGTAEVDTSKPQGELPFELVEYQAHPISFDAEVRGTEDLDIQLEVADINGWQVRGTLECSFPTTVTLMAELDGSDPADPVWSFNDETPMARTEREVPCGASAPFTALLDERRGKLRTDTYRWVVTASQSNGRTTVEDSVAGAQERPWGQPLRRRVAATGAGAPDALSLAPRLVDRDGQVRARVRIDCEAGRSLDLRVVVTQVANLLTISGASLKVPHTCNGNEVVEIPVRARNGLLWAGAATATVTAIDERGATYTAGAPAVIPRVMVPRSLVARPVADHEVSLISRHLDGVETTITCQPGAALGYPRLWVSFREGRLVKEQPHFSSQRGNALLLDLACDGAPQAERIPLWPDLEAPSAVVRMSFGEEPPQEARLDLPQD